MKEKKLKKILNSAGIAIIFVSAFLFIVPVANADETDVEYFGGTPKLYKPSDETRNSIVLTFEEGGFANAEMYAIVSIKNIYTGDLVEKGYTVKLNDEGAGSVLVGGLMSGTRYDFKVRLMEMNSNRSTNNSSSRDAKTLE